MVNAQTEIVDSTPVECWFYKATTPRLVRWVRPGKGVVPFPHRACGSNG